MVELIKIIHLLSLMFGAVASFGNLYMMMAKGPHDLPAPEFANQLRTLFRFTALGAIIVIWISGILLMLINYGWWVQSFAFDVKITFATILLLIIIFLNLMTGRSSKSSGDPPSYIPVLHTVGSASLVLAVIFAVISFG
ncbi:MAG: hypothetical protein GY761_13265 [Hyphomicrobiales bacterium]|nr:hypothetical protein [Hyphomicrobiales bacterium]